MVRFMILGLLALAGIAMAYQKGMQSKICSNFYHAECRTDGCEKYGQSTLNKMSCDDGDGDCCLGKAKPPVDQANPRYIDVCGSQMPSSRIVGGETTRQCEWPFTTLVALRFYFDTDTGPTGNSTFCSGSLIHEDLVVTTANCVRLFVHPDGIQYLRNVFVIVGEYDSRRTDINFGEPEDKVRIGEILLHPQSDGFDHNIALIRLERKIKYNGCKTPACLPNVMNSGCNKIRSDCQMAGLGVKYEPVQGQEISFYPLPTKAAVRVFDAASSSAISRYSQGAYKAEGTMIIEPLLPGVRACAFDWGGVVVCPIDGRWILTGLISFTNCLQDGNVPILAVDIWQYRDWIDRCWTSFDNCR